MTLFILGLGGTMRPNSSAEKALRISLAAAAHEGATTLLLGGDDLALPFYTPQDPARPEKAQRLVQEMRRCNGLIIASPGYHGTLSGLVKNALDYAEDLRNDTYPYFQNRAVGCIATASGWQAAVTTLGALRSVAHALRGWPTPLGASINTSQTPFDETGSCSVPAAQSQLETIGRQVVEFARMRALTLASPAVHPRMT